MFLVATLLALRLSWPDATTIAVKYVRPSRLLETMANLGQSDHFSISAEDLRGVLRLEGDEEGIKEARSLIAQFDVAPRMVDIQLEIDSPVDRTRNQMTARIYTNQTWSTSDVWTGTKFEITPRVNEDNTVTFHVVYKREKDVDVDFLERQDNNAETVLNPLIEANWAKKPKLPDPKIKLKASVSDATFAPEPTHLP